MNGANINKDVKLINKDFATLRDSLMQFAQTYFPDTYGDFNQSSLGMMYIEMSAYVGDVLSYYIDNNVKESMLSLASDKKNVINLSQKNGYTYNNVYPSFTDLYVTQRVPSKMNTSGEFIVDTKYGLIINSGMVVSSRSNPSVSFRTVAPVDFTRYEPTEWYQSVVDEFDESGNPLFYSITKKVPVIAGTVYNASYSFTTPQKYSKIVLPYDDVIQILDIIDSDGGRWYEVEYLAQDTVMIGMENSQYKSDIYYTDDNTEKVTDILKMKRVAKRYIVRKNDKNQTEIRFGAGTSAYPDQVLIPNPSTIKYNTGFSKFTDATQQFMNTATYGIAPSNTTLTVRYVRGGGVKSNVPQGDITIVKDITYVNQDFTYQNETERNLFQFVKSSIEVTNRESATGGGEGDSIESIRNNSETYFFAQRRCVSIPDYISMIYSMPSKYGNVPKVYAEKDGADSLAVNIYTLGYDVNKNLTLLNDVVKQNMMTFLDFHRTAVSAINVKDAYIINIGINFEIITYAGYNKNELILKCINKLKDFFNIDNWQIGQPIVLRDIQEMLDSVEGVRTVSKLEIVNLYDSTLGYSTNYYHIGAATKNGIIYPSRDPSIFEIKYPNKDIKGR